MGAPVVCDPNWRLAAQSGKLRSTLARRSCSSVWVAWASAAVADATPAARMAAAIQSCEGRPRKGGLRLPCFTAALDPAGGMLNKPLA
jgi:hypothetical protein